MTHFVTDTDGGYEILGFYLLVSSLEAHAVSKADGIEE